MKKSIKKTTIASKVNETLKPFRGNVKQSLHELFKHGTTCTGSSGYSKGWASKSIWTKETISACQNLGLSVHSGNSAPRGGASGEWVKLVEDKRKNKLAQQYRAIYVRALKIWDIRKKKTALQEEQLRNFYIKQTEVLFESKKTEILEEIKKQYPALNFSHKHSNSIAWHIGNKLMDGKFHQTTLRTLIKDIRP